MINHIYQLVYPRNFSIKYEDINSYDNLLVRPLYMSICHADQRYYLGQRDTKKLEQKLPMALIHESMGEVVFDPTHTYKSGQKVVMIPNIPGDYRKETIYENYRKDSGFMSSGYDGFMRELVRMPLDRVVCCDNIDFRVSSICEFISVAVHAVNRFISTSHNIRQKIGIWGDGSLGYVLSCVLKQLFPEYHITVIGQDRFKLSQFTFVNETYLADCIPSNFEIDHAFECAGGDGSYYAIDDIIRYINPQGSVMLLGVTENKVSINTRDILEKGLTFIGSSRSGKSDFEKAIQLLKLTRFQDRIMRIIYEDSPVRSIEDIHRVFKTDLTTSFKTIFKWEL